MLHNKNYCSNCGKYGHYFKKCNEPITSLGIICFKFDKTLNINHSKLNEFITKKYLKIDDFNFENLSNISNINFLKDKIKFLLVRRKHSLNYIEFIRGSYETKDLKKLVNMFELMSPEEIKNIEIKNFDHIWNNLWKKTSKYKQYKKEYNKSKKLFNSLIKSKLLDKLIEIKPIYEEPEWGLPKGRRNNYEKNIDCAMREFYEETHIENKDYIILKNIDTIHENYKGTNGINYRHIYYLSISKSENELINLKDNYEIGDVGWYSWNEIMIMIRPYYRSKLEIINKLFLFAMNIFIESNNKNIQNEIS
jgi:8-oxo-dGTP pyrophosphatase MutT (NUDIX family)